jgi:oligoribonuclease NrnB/cAMP/cGMP phosphodiesterase (DHH superfamily)
MKTTVIHHSADFDGLFCREIARKFLPDAELIGWDFKDPKIPFPSEGTVYVLDLSPDCFENLPAHQERLIWIDHHKSSIEKWPSVIPGYRIDGVAACRLAWQYFSKWSQNAVEISKTILPTKQDFIDRTVSEPLAVRLAGEYDIWDKRDLNAETFQFGLRSIELSGYHWKMLLEGSVSATLQGTGMEITDSELLCGKLLENGRMLQAYQQRNDAGMMHRSFIVEFEGLKFLALTTARCNSLTFMSKDVPDTGNDALMGFYYDGKAWNISLYHAKHNTGIDLSQIAVKYGGGGHRGACGFRAEKLPFIN